MTRSENVAGPGDARISNAWADRNKDPILEVLRQVLPAIGRVLEIASGSGQHIVHFAREMPQLRWLPSEIDAANLASIRAWAAEARLSNLLEPIELDVRSRDWGVGSLEVVFNANMVHISPWSCCEALLTGAERHLETGGVLILYGPFRIGGRHTAPSNAAFDESLRGRDPTWGVRDMEAVCELASGLELVDRFEMPANNQTLVLRKVGG